MGGNLPLGYDAPTDPQTRALVVNEAQAETVRSIFQAYLELGSVAALEAHLARTGICSKLSTSLTGTTRGGVPLSRGALYHLLQNRVYLGEIPHRTESYPGAHPPIVPVELFDKVQAQVASSRRARRARPLRSAGMALKGLIFDADGHPMSPSFCFGRSGKVYRYYVSAPLQQGRKCKTDDPAPRRVSAPAVEEQLRVELTRLFAANDGAPLHELLRSVRRVELSAEGVRLVLPIKDTPRAARAHVVAVPDDPGLGELWLAIRCRVRGGRTWIAGPDGSPPITRRDPVLIRGLRQAHRLATDLGWRMSDGALTARDSKAPESAYERKLCRLSFLAPDIQTAILDGRQPLGLTLDALLRSEIPLGWAKQRKLLGFS